MVSDEQIGSIVRSSTPQRASMALIELANRNGGHDNISVAIVRRGATSGLEAGFATVEDTPRRNGGWVVALMLVAAVGAFFAATQTGLFGRPSDPPVALQGKKPVASSHTAPQILIAPAPIARGKTIPHGLVASLHASFRTGSRRSPATRTTRCAYASSCRG